MRGWSTIARAPRYEITEFGDVRRKQAIGKTTPGPVLKPITNGKNAHQLVRLGTDHGVINCFIHRLVAETFIGPSPEGKPIVAHYDGDPTNNHVSNLRWASHRENCEDQARHGTDPAGERNPNARFNETDIRLMRAHAERGERHKVIAFLWGTSAEYVGNVVRRRVWRHLEP